MSHYRDVVIETFENPGEPAAERIRARPLPGQGLDTTMRVSCSSSMREKFKPGTKVKIRAKVTDREGGTPYLYCHHSWAYEVLTDDEATVFIQDQYSRSL